VAPSWGPFGAPGGGAPALSSRWPGWGPFRPVLGACFRLLLGPGGGPSGPRMGPFRGPKGPARPVPPVPVLAPFWGLFWGPPLGPPSGPQGTPFGPFSALLGPFGLPAPWALRAPGRAFWACFRVVLGASGPKPPQEPPWPLRAPEGRVWPVFRCFSGVFCLFSGPFSALLALRAKSASVGPLGPMGPSGAPPGFGAFLGCFSVFFRVPFPRLRRGPGALVPVSGLGPQKARSGAPKRALLGSFSGGFGRVFRPPAGKPGNPLRRPPGPGPLGGPSGALFGGCFSASFLGSRVLWALPGPNP